MFYAQFFAVVWLSLVQIATYNFLRGNIDGVCSSTQKQGITCPNAKTFFNASVIWGVVGPKRMFSSGALYSKHEPSLMILRLQFSPRDLQGRSSPESAAKTSLPRLDQLFLVDRRRPACHSVFRRPSLSPWNLPIPVLPSHLRRRRPDPSGHVLVPGAVGHCRTHFQLFHPESLLRLVE